MKKIALLLAFVLLILPVLSGCSDNLFTTAKYKQYKSFYEKHKTGMEKQEIINKLGFPYSLVDADGNSYSIAYSDRDAFKANLAEDSSVCWFYHCWKYSDPCEEYNLKISFDEEGKSTSVDFIALPA